MCLILLLFVLCMHLSNLIIGFFSFFVLISLAEDVTSKALFFIAFQVLILSFLGTFPFFLFFLDLFSLGLHLMTSISLFFSVLSVFVCLPD